MTIIKTPTFIQSLFPVGILILFLALNIRFFDEALGGANQVALFMATAAGGLIGRYNGVQWEQMQQKILHTIHSALPSILILLLIGGLSGAWMISGVIPMMIYYGIDIMHPSYFLLATVILCSVVSIATGSSWSTIATIGVAVIGVGNAFGLNPGLVAGAVISGAYFGDKMSPLSDTTNLAPAVAGSDLFTHIRYMLYTTGPSLILTLLIFGIIGLFHIGNNQEIHTGFIKQGIAETFYISPVLLFVPALLLFIIIKKIPPIPAMAAGIASGILFAFLFQPDLLNRLISNLDFHNKYQLLMQAVFGGMNLQTGVTEVDRLLSTGGMSGMLNTVWLILSALCFGGIMDACGFLKKVTETFLLFITNRTSLAGSTVLTCLFFNLTACDQYLAIVIPGKMLQKLYRDKGYRPEVLSRTLEDSATVTSVLVPWNSCGATHSRVLGVATAEYLPYCFFNLISPLMNIFITAVNYKIRKIRKTT